MLEFESGMLNQTKAIEQVSNFIILHLVTSHFFSLKLITLILSFQVQVKQGKMRTFYTWKRMCAQHKVSWDSHFSQQRNDQTTEK